MPRISSSMIHQQALTGIRRNQVEIARLQDGVASGRRIQRPSDDPAGASRALDIGETLDRLEQYQVNARLADQRLALEDSTLEGVQNLITRIKELSLAANSGTQTPETRNAISTEVSERLANLLDLANVRDANGDHLFSGFQGRTRPFEITGTTVSYVGDQGARDIQISTTQRVTAGDSGDRVFMRVPPGNGRFSVSADAANTGRGVLAPGSVTDEAAYTGDAYSIRFTGPATFDVVNDTLGVTVLAAQPFTENAAITFDGITTRIQNQPAAGDRFDVTPGGSQSLFETLQMFMAALAIDPVDGATAAKQSQAMSHVIDSLDRGLEHVLDVRATVGARLSALEAVETQNADLRFELQSTLSQVRDLDMVQAISSLQQRITALEAVQQSFAAVSRLSLFNYLR